MRKSEYSHVTSRLSADRVFDCGIIPHTTVSKHTKIYDVSLLQQVYLQHGSGNCC